jgi:poly(3-hydroxybutyrate) depolymerase
LGVVVGGACDRGEHKPSTRGASGSSSPASAAGGPQAATQSLAGARRGFHTHLLRTISNPEPPEVPPEQLFELVKYPSPAGELAAYVSRPGASAAPAGPQRRRPAIIWIFGGFGNGIGATAWTDFPASNDQSASAFWKAGIVTMYPSFRGGCGNPGAQEVFYGEVEDVLAAAAYLAKRDDVDPNRIYLGGHSTGGTLALLVSEMAPTKRFRAIFASGAIDDVAGYGSDEFPFDASNAREIKLRSPIHWLEGITTPTWAFEGGGGRGNLTALLAMKRATHNPAVQFFPVAGADHFSILRPLTQLIAEKILRDTGAAETNVTFSFDETNRLMLK